MRTNALTFLDAYQDVYKGDEIRPRGSVCREQTDCILGLDMKEEFLTSFRARKLNLKYAKEELKWYIRADKFDQSIEKHATMWQKIRQPDGSYYSNYGQYIFGSPRGGPSQFTFVVDELTRDPWSRRASIVLLKAEHLYAENKDVVCTYAMNFRIRRDKLDMSVSMRSNDIIFGMTNDVFCFGMIYRMVYAMLSGTAYKQLGPGMYHHKVDSLHVYDRHYAMIEEIIKDDMGGYVHIKTPWPTPEEVARTIETGYVHADRGKWSTWLES